MIVGILEFPKNSSSVSLSAGSAFMCFLALKPCAALRLTQKLLLAFLCYA
ncbi:hypothetical protein [Campylobacter sp.]|nr:hypothetical protein [Campylobacter sp.]MCI7446468.1 hypothetical protein [Campylobacter sp.]